MNDLLDMDRAIGKFRLKIWLDEEGTNYVLKTLTMAENDVMKYVKKLSLSGVHYSTSTGTGNKVFIPYHKIYRIEIEEVTIDINLESDQNADV